MANGFCSIHPATEHKLRALGLTSGAVTQGYGSAAASAGFHEAVGTIDGHPWSPCFDLSHYDVPFDRASLSRLVDAGFAAFGRNSANGWGGVEHWHCIDVCLGRLLPGVETQVHDFCNGRSGLAGHHAFTGPLAPDKSQQQAIREVFLSGKPRVPVTVLDTIGRPIPCYGFIEDDTSRVEVRPMVEHCGGVVTSPRTFTIGGITTDFEKARPEVSGDFLRADLRGLASSLGLGIEFAMDADGRAATVRLVRPAAKEAA